MMQWVLKCRPAARHAVRGKVAGTATIVGAGVAAPRPAPAIRQGGPVCRWELVSTADAPLYGGALPPGFYGTPSFAEPMPYPATGTHADTAVAGMGNGDFGGYGSALDTRDFAALILMPDASVLPPGDALVLLPGRDVPGLPVTVPEPAALALFVVALAGLAWARGSRHG